MYKKIILLRTAYWIGIIADAYMAIKLMLLPFKSGVIFKPEMETSACLMIGWTMLLIWADRKPIERRVILLFTIIIMTIGRLIEILAIFMNKISFNDALISGLSTFFLLSYFVFIYIYITIKLKNPDKA